MTAAVLCAAVALVAWPQRRPPGRLRGPGRRPWAADGLPAPSAALIGAGVALAGALLSTPLVSVLGGGCAALAARALRARQRGARATGELLALAEALTVLAAELSAGREVDRAVTTAGGACPDLATGRALMAALRDEPPSLERAAGPATAALERVRRAARLSARTGCSLASVASALADDLRARHRAEQELRAATAAPRASATVLAGLPLLGLAMGSGVGADPWHVLTGTGAGEVLLVGGVVLEVLGIGWTGRLLRRAVTDPEPPAARRAA